MPGLTKFPCRRCGEQPVIKKWWDGGVTLVCPDCLESVRKSSLKEAVVFWDLIMETVILNTEEE